MYFRDGEISRPLCLRGERFSGWLPRQVGGQLFGPCHDGMWSVGGDEIVRWLDDAAHGAAQTAGLVRGKRHTVAPAMQAANQ